MSFIQECVGPPVRESRISSINHPLYDCVEISRPAKASPTPRGRAVIVSEFSLRIQPGKFNGLIGDSGCAKSTVRLMLDGVREIPSGGIVLAGKELVGAGPDHGAGFQSPCLLSWRTAFENGMLSVDQVYYTVSARERRQILKYYLALVGLGDPFHQKSAELSQGMRKRVGIARSFAPSRKMLLLDEPFGMLDTLTPGAQLSIHSETTAVITP